MLMSRRSILKFTVAGIASIPLLSRAAEDDEKLILSAPLTHPDWTLKPNIAWGPQGVHHMLDACKACGWSTDAVSSRASR